MRKEELKIVFMGTPEFAVGTLQALVEGGYNVVAVVTQPDKPVGRHHDTLASPPVKRYALAHGLPVMQPERMKDETFIGRLRGYDADVQVVTAFRMLPEAVWGMPRFGTFNVHASLLPQYRGAAPINRAIINGETLTGITTFFLDRDMDTGRIILQKPYVIADDSNAGDVYDALMALGAQAAVETVDRIIAGNGHTESLPQQATGELKTAPKIFKDTCRITWDARAKNIYDFIRGLSPTPGAWTMMTTDDGTTTMVKIYRARKTDRHAQDKAGTMTADGGRLYIAAADNLLEIEELQPAGRKRMSGKDYVNGMRNIRYNSYLCK